MARKHNIRWRDSDTQELQRLIKNYNAKLTRLSKKEGNFVDYLPERMTVTKAKAKIETRDDYKRLLQSLQRFTERGSETLITTKRGAKMTQWELDEIELIRKRENRLRERERKRLEKQKVKIANEPQSATRAQMGSIQSNELKELTQNVETMNQTEWNKFKTAMEKRFSEKYTDKERLYKQVNYMRGLHNAGFDEELINYISTIPQEKFMEILSTDEVGYFEFIYDPIDLAVKQDKLWDLWEEHGTGQNQIDGLTWEDIQAFDTLANSSDYSSTAHSSFFFKYFEL